MKPEERNQPDKAEQYALAVRVLRLVLRVAAIIADIWFGGNGPWW